MVKTKEELKALKQEFEVLITKLIDLNEDELAQIAGGIDDLNANLYFIAEELGLPTNKD